MKLYNRDQMIEAMRFVFMHEADETPVEFIDTLTPIELPNDEELVEKLRPFNDEYVAGYYSAINMIEEQIKQQDK